MGPVPMTARELRAAAPRAGAFCTGVSANVFQASHVGQRPSHRADSKPQALQKKAVFVLATSVPRRDQEIAAAKSIVRHA
ncbi:MAG: hypothetical protein NVS2B17_02430 [Candidatus Velthaea sp.]